MSFTLRADGTWYCVGTLTCYRFLLDSATYDVAGPWPSDGRFDVDRVHTLYVSLSPEAAVAEYYRRHPELLQFQDSVRLRLYELELSVLDEGLDVGSPPLAALVGIEWNRLTSSDRKKAVRFAETRSLARSVIREPGGSIRYPSGAWADGVNIVTFGENGHSATVRSLIATPWLDAGLVKPLPAGAEP